MTDQGLDSETVRQRHSYAKGFNQTLARWRVTSLRKHCRGESCLDVGCGEGDVTLELRDLFTRMVGIDLTERHLAAFAARRPPPNITLWLGSVMGFETLQRFDTVIAVDVLEHVDDTGAVLAKLAGLLAPQGLLLCVVPNAASLHRRLGKAMGLIQSLDELGEQDHSVGHRRYYDFASLRATLTGAGYVVHSMEGIVLKPLPNRQMEAIAPAYLDALYQVGAELPEYCAEILAVAGR
jgi:2-polyprenyl-3-methyl-5-hydroxy-6-metoxy-1,4-benzoquinol methylase